MASLLTPTGLGVREGVYLAGNADSGQQRGVGGGAGNAAVDNAGGSADGVVYHGFAR